ncbi:MAG: polysaccharide pyruvyl transferase family protein [Pseudomonadota bacterium]
MNVVVNPSLLRPSHQQSTGRDVTAVPSTALLNAYSTRNLGDAAIMASIAAMLPERCAQVALHSESQIDVPGIALTDVVHSARRFVSVGGDIFNNSRPRLITRSYLRNIQQLRAHASRTIVFGQTIPSSCGWLGLPMLTAALRRVRAVVVRDSESHDLLKRSGVDADLSFDAAFSLAPTQSGIAAAVAHFAGRGLDPARTVLLSIRSFDSIYRQDPDLFLARMARLADLLIARGHQVAVLIQSDVNTNDSDAVIAQALHCRVPAVRILDLFEPVGTHDRVATLIGALAIANIVVAVRYHGAVLRLVGGRQPYNLYYSRKGRELQKRLGLTGCALDDFCPEDAIPEIEATADRGFDPSPVSENVRGAFDRAYARIA